MKKLLVVFALIVLTTLSFSQSGPTQPSVTLTWTQGSGCTVTADCVYRCTGSACTPAPSALFCSTAPITSYLDSNVLRGTTYVYAVTAKCGATESGYSGTISATPPTINAPSGLNVTLVSGLGGPEVQATWVLASTPNVVWQDVFRQQGACTGKFVQIGEVLANVDTYVDTRPRVGCEAYYVSAVTKSGAGKGYLIGPPSNISSLQVSK